jgi:V8-like Glu-specific endopeptidase
MNRTQPSVMGSLSGCSKTMVALSLLLCACAPAPHGGERGASQQVVNGILGGQVVATDDPVAWSTVALLKSSDGQTAKPYCSATLVADDALVTAAHCVKLLPDGHVLFAFFGH